jgi:hypothetical protein
MRPARATLEALFENAPRFVERLAGGEYESWDDLLARVRWRAPCLRPRSSS